MTNYRLGILCPSSNTVLEPMTQRILSGADNIVPHFTRFKVTEIDMSQDTVAQFDNEVRIAASELLSHAKVHVIGALVAPGGWVGFDADEELCRGITERTGKPSTTSVLAVNELLRETGVKRYGLVSTYVAPVQEKIIANYAAIGLECVGEHHMGIADNFAFGQVTEDEIAEAARKVASTRPEAIMFYNTNLRSARVAVELEREFNIPCYDLLSVGIWKCLQLAGADTSSIVGWGAFFGRQSLNAVPA
ncbi:Asp/Glu/hydantoin racemase [Ensifer adhaerens]|uniref:Asp/Glu/hydantoin racemase n=1 Tax=Ensifer adhaerens TaxID=106592 RepID=A0A9Q8YJ84_ENSAD|nr:Asp/Glu/hydantoin racemase [Ensifer adhaerens]USJ28429.1 Asp/Glu/hydantoin racemase [Ensifer adhaerens]